MYKIETKCVQEGYQPKNGEPRVLPIFQSTTYKYDSSEHLGKLFDLTAPGHMYTRISNPTVECVENKIAALEKGVGAMCVSSGQAANMFAVLNISRAGDNFVSLTTIYGGTTNLFGVTLERMGVDVRFCEPSFTDEQIEALIDENTRCLFGETIANPSLDVLDIERFAKIAHKHGIPLIVDNTFATPVNCNPFDFGADVVTHSTTKYMDGHACVVGGVIVDSGNFNWASEKFPMFTEPDESYHGIVYSESFGKLAYITKARVQLLRDIGATPSPMNAFLLNLGLETLHLRMARHCENALKVAEFLKENDKISWVHYPDLAGDSEYERAKKYLPKGSCGVISCGIKGGRDAAMKFMDSLELAAIVVHVADSRTSVLHPASTTHRQLSDSQLVAAGISPDLVRLSVGTENVEDIIEDIKQALNKI